MLPTPSTSHVNFDHIYEPAEDSYLLLDTLVSPTETAFLQERFSSPSPSPLIVEVGTGSGVVLAFATSNAHHIFGRRDSVSLGVDVNSFACKATAQTVNGAIKDAKPGEAGAFMASVCGDLATSLRPGTVDVLIFNPPYVPTEDLPQNYNDQSDYTSLSNMDRFERDSHLLALSYAGGTDGMETTDRLLDQIPGVLSGRGVAYVLLCKQNKPNEVAARVRTWFGGPWQAEVVGSSGKQAGWEKLCILRIWRP